MKPKITGGIVGSCTDGITGERTYWMLFLYCGVRYQILIGVER